MTDRKNTDNDPAATPAWKGDHPAEGEIGNRYDPSPEEVTRARQQGLGVGAEDLALQQDLVGEPSEREYADRVSREAAEEEEAEAAKADRRDGRQ